MNKKGKNDGKNDENNENNDAQRKNLYPPLHLAIVIVV